MTHISARRVVVALDCSDARELAEFYATMLGWRIHDDPAYDGWVDVLPPEGEDRALALGFQTVPDFRPPTWPEGEVPQQIHQDFYVGSIAEAEPAVLAAGGRRHEVQYSEEGLFVVSLDPVGHPFCLCVE